MMFEETGPPTSRGGLLRRTVTAVVERARRAVLAVRARGDLFGNALIPQA
jgi:hypothetical protein